MDSIVTPEFRVSFPNVFKPKRNDLSGRDEYSVVALFAKGENLDKLKALAHAAAEKKWGPDQAKWPSTLRKPFRDQGERAKEGVLPPGHEAGAVFLNLKSTQKIGVVDQNVQPIMDETQFYSGCYAKAQVTAYAYDNKGNRGIAFGLQNIQKTKDGDPLTGRMRPEDAFKPVEGAQAATSSALFD